MAGSLEKRKAKKRKVSTGEAKEAPVCRGASVSPWSAKKKSVLQKKKRGVSGGKKGAAEKDGRKKRRKSLREKAEVNPFAG